ncbi:MAG: aminotransferase class I/II-fold pyridoxal phosphate-dependent enzyme [candidate division WOR-3 bacterium]|nr:aminotransferase class I/II-fold pyridoxal phosphate-dependent enzyme [candidate division WOR-3 bacterium]
MKLSSRLNAIPPYVFDEIDKLKRQTENPVDFGVGDPDLPTPDFIINEMEEQLGKPANHRYPSYNGMRELRETIASYMKERFNVDADPEKEIMVLIGSKEGLAHLMQALIEEGDEMLIPSICYPVYRVQSNLWGARTVEFPVHYENNFTPIIEDIESLITHSTKALMLNYPNNPTGAVVDIDFYAQITEMAYERGIAVINDCVYADIHSPALPPPPSMLSSSKGMETGIEFHSLSKTFNMTGWRIGFAVGNEKLINGLRKIKMNTDSGVFRPIQYAAIEALENGSEHIKYNNRIIADRINRLADALEQKGLEFHRPPATFYILAKTRMGMNSMEFTKYLIKNAGIITTPGIGFGQSGDGFIRFSLTLPDSEIDRGIEKIGKLEL